MNSPPDGEGRRKGNGRWGKVSDRCPAICQRLYFGMEPSCSWAHRAAVRRPAPGSLAAPLRSMMAATSRPCVSHGPGGLGEGSSADTIIAAFVAAKIGRCSSPASTTSPIRCSPCMAPGASSLLDTRFRSAWRPHRRRHRPESRRAGRSAGTPACLRCLSSALHGPAGPPTAPARGLAGSPLGGPLANGPLLKSSCTPKSGRVLEVRAAPTPSTMPQHQT